MASHAVITGTYDPKAANQTWTVWTPDSDLQHTIDIINTAAKTEQPSTIRAEGTWWPTFHKHSQGGRYLQTEGILAATDGSLKNQNFGGGIAYMEGD